MVRRGAAEVRPEDLIDCARGWLAGYKCPTSAEFTDKLPRNASGKILEEGAEGPVRLGLSLAAPRET